MKKYFSLLILMLFCSEIIFAQSIAPAKIVVVRKNSNLKEIRTGGFNFINPILDYFEINSSTLSSDKLLQTKLNNYIHNEILAGNINSASVYYRDLNNGPWIGINENEVYSPASLLKVPYLFAALKLAQLDNGFLSKQVTYIPGGNNKNQSITDSFALIPENTYTMNDLLSAMIIHSDNEAKDIIVKNIPYEIYTEIFNDLGIDIQKQDAIAGASNFLSVKDYAAFFRILYNATYLNKEMSEYALWLLSNTTFNDGLKAGLPDSIKLSHKFGERFFSNSDIKQLHDCGIIYKPNQIYILCIMTKGTDNKKMQKVISGVSKMAYTHLVQEHKIKH